MMKKIKEKERLMAITEELPKLIQKNKHIDLIFRYKPEAIQLRQLLRILNDIGK